jgi:hypothetical protein
MGCFTGSGFLDLSIVTEGVRDVPPIIKILSSAPHVGLGLFALWFGWANGERTPNGLSAA